MASTKAWSCSAPTAITQSYASFQETLIQKDFRNSSNSSLASSMVLSLEATPHLSAHGTDTALRRTPCSQTGHRSCVDSSHDSGLTLRGPRRRQTREASRTAGRSSWSLHCRFKLTRVNHLCSLRWMRVELTDAEHYLAILPVFISVIISPTFAIWPLSKFNFCDHFTESLLALVP